MPDEPVEILSLEQLAALLARDDAREWDGVFHGVAFEVFERGHGHVEPGPSAPLSRPASAGVSGGMLVVDLIGNLLEAGKSGWYLRVWLPVPLAMDLLLTRRPEPAGGAGLEAEYEVRAANRAFALRRLTPLAPMLLSIAERYENVELRDDALELGPLDREPRETAADLALLIHALPLLTPPDLPGAEQQSAFCHFCGHGVAEDARECPRCGERLDEDDDG